jgi:YVTN family beta-propeller protein
LSTLGARGISGTGREVADDGVAVVRGRIGLALACVLGIAVRRAPAATLVWVADDGAQRDQLSLVDPAAAQVVGTITVPGPATGIAFSPDARKAYVVTSGNAVALAIVDTATRKIDGVVPIGVPDCVDGAVAVDAAGTHAYVTGGPFDRVLTVVDLAGAAVARTVSSGTRNGECARGVAVSPAGDRVYVSGSGRTAWIVDAASGALTPVDAGITFAGPVAVTADGSRVFLPGGGEGQPGSVAVLDAGGTPQPSIPLGTFVADALAVLPGGRSLYVGGFDGAGNGTSLLRVSSSGAATGVPLPTTPRALALSSDAARLFVAGLNAESGSLSIVDTATDTVTATVPVGPSPRAVAVPPDSCTGALVAACDDGNPCTTDVCQGGACGHALVRDGTPCDACDADRTCAGGACTSTPFDCTPAAAIAYVPVFAGGAVGIVDLASNTSTSVAVERGPWGAAADERGGRAFVTNRRSRSLSIVDGATATVQATVELGGTPLGVAADPQSGLAYVANYGRDSVDVVAPDTATRVARIRVGHGPVALAVHPAGDRLYVSDYLGDAVSVVDVAARRVVATVPVGRTPLGLAVHPDGTRLYVADYRDGTVSVVGTAANRPLRTIRVGRQPFGVAADPAGGRVFVSNLGDGTVSVIDTTAEKVVAEIAVGRFPFGVAVDPATHRLDVATGGDAGMLATLDPTSGLPVASTAVGGVPVSLGQFVAARPGACPPRPIQCDDANPATADTCSSAGCRHDALPAGAGASAAAAELAVAIRTAPPGALGTGGLVTRIAQAVDDIAAGLPPPPARPDASDRARALHALRVVAHLLRVLGRDPAVQPATLERVVDLTRTVTRLVRRLR